MPDKRQVSAMAKSSRVKVEAEAHGDNWSAYQSDCVPFVCQLPDNCIRLSVYSPPFANLYTYSSRIEDMGNCKDHETFFEQYRFLIAEMLRATVPGRLSCVHCVDLTTFKWKGEEIGLHDFSGQITRAHIDAGWIFHCRITIWKDPVTEMQRTKALGLLHKQIKKDSSMSRVGNPDYVLVFRKPGVNPEPITHHDNSIPVDLWQKWASPIWMDINQGKILDTDGAREERDEKHICPLQLDTIERCVNLWSNPGDIVFSPFMGIGSEGYQSIKFNRKFIGTELKETYYKQAVAFLKKAEAEQGTLF